MNEHRWSRYDPICKMRVHRELKRYIGLVLTTLIITPWALGLDAGAVITLAADAQRNGVSVTAGVMTGNGDWLRTSPQGSLTLSLTNSVVEFGHKTNVQLTDHGLRLVHGYIHVRGGLRVLQGTRKLQPVSNSSEFEVVQLAGGRAYLHVMRGAIAMQGFSQPVSVSAGFAVTYFQQTNQTEPNGQPGTADQTQANQNEPTGGQTQTGAQSPSPQAQQPTPSGESPPAQQPTESTSQQTTTTTTTTTTATVQPLPPLESGGARPAAEVPTRVAVGVIIAAALISGLITYEATKTSASPTH